MSSPTTRVRRLARTLIALEASRAGRNGVSVLDVASVCDRLRTALVQATGVAGYRSLMLRATALAKVDAPALDSLQVGPDGTLEGLEGLVGHQDAAVAVVVHLLSLLVTVVGGGLTLCFVREAWPAASFGVLETGAEEIS